MASGDAAAMIRLRTRALGPGGLRVLFDCLRSIAYRSRRQSARRTIAAVREQLWQGRSEGGAIDSANPGNTAFANFRCCRSVHADQNADDCRPSRSVYLTKRKRNPCVYLVILSGMALISGCHQAPTEEQVAERRLKGATSPTAMWYRFKFEGDYQGHPFKFDQMVYCGRDIIPGGSLGQSPNEVIREAAPMTVAQRMFDGSQILVRVPNMCSRYRKFDRRDGRWTYRPGWKSRGPHSVIPYVVWSDKMPRPDRMESYVAEAYYHDERARIKNPRGSLELWPEGRYPPNYAAVLAQERMALPYYPNPWINPNQKNGTTGRDGRYHEEPAQFASYFIVPIVNFNDWIERYGPDAALAAAKKQAILVPRDDIVLIPSLQPDEPLVAVPTFHHARFVAYKYSTSERGYVLDAEPSFVTADCVLSSATNLMGGRPGMSQFPYDAEDNGTSWPDGLAAGLPGYDELAREKMRRVLAGRQGRMRACYKRLDELRSFDVIDGRLATSQSIPGALVYRRWYQARPKSIPASDTLRASGAIDGMNVRFRVLSSAFDYPLFGQGGHESPSVIVHDKSTNQSYIIGFFATVIASKGGDGI